MTGPSLQAQEHRLAVLPKAVLPPQTQEPRLQFYQGLNRCDSFPLISAPHSLFSFWTDLKRSGKIPGAPTRRWGEWIWLTGLSGLHQNSPQGFNISSIRDCDQIRDSEIPYLSKLLSLLRDIHFLLRVYIVSVIRSHFNFEILCFVYNNCTSIESFPWNQNKL